MEVCVCSCIFKNLYSEINSVFYSVYSGKIAMARAITLSEAQNVVFQRIAQCVGKPTEVLNGNVFMVHGAAGTGKTFLLNQIMNHCLTENIKAIAVAYTGIASCLLPKGKSVHSLFRIPWNQQQVSCAIEPNHWVYKTIKKASVLVWDQAAFCSRQIIEEVNGFLQNMMKSQQLFGGKLIVMSADFLECSPIVIGAAQNETPESHSILFSSLYSQMQRFQLNDNYRFTSPADFHWCIEIGNGLRNEISVPNECRVYDMDTLINSIYGHGYASMTTDDIMERSIFTVITDDVDILNTKCLNQLFPTKFSCQSINYFRKIDQDQRSRFYDMDSVMERLPKYFPPDILQLTENCPIMLTQSYQGLAAGTRLIVKSVMENKIVAEIGVGNRKGKTIKIYRVLTKKTFHHGNVEFIRRQFPIALAFSITINKAQGLEFKRAGVYFPRRVFSHGQLYVVCSRVPDIKNDLKILINCDHQISYDHFPNVVNQNITNFALPN